MNEALSDKPLLAFSFIHLNFLLGRSGTRTERDKRLHVNR